MLRSVGEWANTEIYERVVCSTSKSVAIHGRSFGVAAIPVDGKQAETDPLCFPGLISEIAGCDSFRSVGRARRS